MFMCLLKLPMQMMYDCSVLNVEKHEIASDHFNH